MKGRVIRIGTRGSKLALWQAHEVKHRVEELGYKCELVVMHSHGDLHTDKPLHQLGSQGIFTKVLDEALLKNEIDIAVHSSKDIPTQINEGLSLSATLPREQANDVVLSVKNNFKMEAGRGWVVGTSSLRRQALTNYYYEGIEVRMLRGNLDTRVRRMEEGVYDCIILAYAGVKRLGYEKYVTEVLSVERFVPCVGQGAIGIVAQRSDEEVQRLLSTLNDKPTYYSLLLERNYLRSIAGGCQKPVFGYAQKIENQFRFLYGVASIDGSQIIKEEFVIDYTEEVDTIEEIGNKLGQNILRNGGYEIITS